jgi:hypothetical protein
VPELLASLVEHIARLPAVDTEIALVAVEDLRGAVALEVEDDCCRCATS